MPAFLWLDPRPRPGWHNMALDAALLDRARRTGAMVLRLYRWSPSCLSFGRHEPAGRRYDRARIEALGLDAVRRPTGGRAVWHAHELTYSITAPLQALGGLREAYLDIHAMLAAAVRRLGAEVDLARAPARSPGLAAGACFAGAVGGELVVAGDKLVGSAQLREGGALLQHGSLLLDGDQHLVTDLALGPAQLTRSRSLAEVLRRPVSFDEAACAVTEAARTWRAGWRLFHEEEAVLGAATAHAARFSDPGWTWNR
ncbi:MAG: biotin/lipoate A/B protein ligase family protein [Gemmatimonadales bacterium]